MGKLLEIIEISCALLKISQQVLYLLQCIINKMF